MISDARGFDKITHKLKAGIWKQTATSDLILMFFVTICIPQHTSAMMQMRQLANDCISDDHDDVPWVSRKIKLSEADVKRQFLKEKFVECSADFEETREVTKTKSSNRKVKKQGSNAWRVSYLVRKAFGTNSIGLTESVQTGQKIKQKC